MKKYRFLTPAILDVEAAATFYEVNQPELGREFLDEVDDTIQRIIQNPRAWRILEGQIRRCRLRRFPYGIVYAIEEESILVISVMHLHRHPNSWRNNLDDEGDRN